MKTLAAMSLALMVLAGCTDAEKFCDSVPDLPKYHETCKNYR